MLKRLEPVHSTNLSAVLRMLFDLLSAARCRGRRSSATHCPLCAAVLPAVAIAADVTHFHSHLSQNTTIEQVTQAVTGETGSNMSVGTTKSRQHCSLVDCYLVPEECTALTFRMQQRHGGSTFQQNVGTRLPDYTVF